MNEHTVARFEIRFDGSFDELRERYETIVPSFDLSGMSAFVERRAPWSEVVRQLDDIAPHGFVRYWKADAGPIMSLAGDEDRCTAYLMGNHAIAQRMFHIDPLVMLYVPIRTLLYRTRTGETRFATDRPSSHLASLGNDDIFAVGRSIDAKLAELLSALGIDPPESLGERNAR